MSRCSGARRPALSCVVVLVAALAAGCAGVPRSPVAAFEQYIDAYGDGDAERLWRLSSPSARADARRLRERMQAILADPDPAVRVRVEGLFGASAGEVAGMDDRAFFGWAIAAIRRRLGPVWVKRAVEQWEEVGVQLLGPQLAIVVYREQVGRLSQMRVVKLADVWYVDTSPFPNEDTGPAAEDTGPAAKEEPPDVSDPSAAPSGGTAPEPLSPRIDPEAP